MADTAIEKVRRFARKVDESTGEVVDLPAVRLDAAAIDIAPPEGYAPEGYADWDDLEGGHPSVPIKTSLKDAVGEVVSIVQVDFTPTPAQFVAEKRARGLDGSELSAVLTWIGEDGRYYVAVVGNARTMRAAATLANMLRRVAAVRARVIEFDSAGGTGYTLGPVGRPA